VPDHEPTAACDIAIVGAGMVGASIAGELAAQVDRGAAPLHVVLLEAEAAPGSHSTGRSAAVFEEGYGPPQVRALTRASRVWFESESPPGTPLLRPRPALFPGRLEDETALRRLAAHLDAEGLATRWLDGAEARRLVPVLREPACAFGLLDLGSADLDVHAVLQRRLRQARAAGFELWTDARVRHLDRVGGAWRLATDDGRVLRATTVVNASGAWADEIARAAGVRRIGLEPRRRSAFVFAPPAGLDVRSWPSVVAADESWYFKPEAGLLLGSPANADPALPHDVQPEELDIATGIARIEAATTLTIRRPQRCWAGLRSFVADGEPVIGMDPEVPGFFWAAALGGYGIQSSPGLAQLVASLLLDRALPDSLRAQGVDPAALSPHRLRPDRLASN
jgi:D-arginine dehydrogenase